MRRKDQQSSEVQTKSSRRDQTLSPSADWEVTISHVHAKSEGRAWAVAKGACFVAVLALATAVVIAVRSDNTPYVWRENTATGEVQQITRLADSVISYEEARDKFWLNRYVLSREVYQWLTIQSDHDLVMLLSAPDVGREYDALFEGDQSLDKKYGQKVQARPTINSIVPNGGGIATIRFSKTVSRVGENVPTEPRAYVATVGYRYDPNLKMDAAQRLLNPYGFQVTSWRTDPDYTGGKQ